MTTPNNHRFRLPSGAFAVRVDGAERRYYVERGWLTTADIEHLYADSISGDGGREPTDHARGLCTYCGQPRNSSLCQKAHP